MARCKGRPSAVKEGNNPCGNELRTAREQSNGMCMGCLPRGSWLQETAAEARRFRMSSTGLPSLDEIIRRALAAG